MSTTAPIPMKLNMVPINEVAGNLYNNTNNINEIRTSITSIAILIFLLLSDIPKTSLIPPVINWSILVKKNNNIIFTTCNMRLDQ